MIEVYIDDYISLVIPTLQEQLQHGANGIIAGMYDAFPVDEDDNKNPFLLKKMKKLDLMWD